MNAASAPVLSVVYLTPTSFNSLRTVMRYVAAQNIAGQIEIVLVAPSAQALKADPDALSAFHSWQVVEMGRLNALAAARAAGIRAANAPIVALGEDQ